jgi:hypothetical protein
METLDKTQMHSAYAFVSVMLLAAAISGATLIRAESAPSAATQSFIGTTPDSDNGETAQAPTF